MPVRMMPDSGGEWPEHLDPAHFREIAGRLACAFARHDALAGASKAIADALAIAYEQGRRHPGTGFASLEKADWAGVVEAAKCPPRS